MDTEKILRTLCEADGNSGAENAAAAVAMELLAPYGAVERDALGNVICRVSPPKNGRHLMLDAHLDQIAMLVTHIDDRGFLRVAKCGGIDPRSIAGTTVRVPTKDGPLYGVVCTVPPHLQGDGEKKNPDLQNLAVDIAFPAEEAKKRVRPGDRVMMTGRFTPMGNGYVAGPALDDRAGCVCILEALELLRGEELPIGLSAVFSTREETGGQGAEAAAFALAPTEAIEMDASFAHTPDTGGEVCGEIKKGPMVCFSPILDQAFCEELLQLAERHEIPCQTEVSGGSTGTNADGIASAGAGVRCAIVSIPQQYMHSVIEKMALQDIRDVGRLLAAYVREGGKTA